MKNKRKIELEIEEKLHKICKKFGTTPKVLFEQLQKDFLGIQETERKYEVILAQLLLSENLASNAQIERGVVEHVLNYMRTYHAQMRKEESIPNKLSMITQSLLEENKYDKKHTKN